MDHTIHVVLWVERVKNRLPHASYAILRIAPLLPMALGLIGGIVLDAHWTLSRWVYGGLFLATSVAGASHRVRMAGGAFVVLIASLCLGGLLHAARTREIAVTSIERYTTDAQRLVRIRGVVVSKPRLRERADTPFKRWTFDSERTVFLLKAASIEGEGGSIDVTGRIHVAIDEAVLDLHEDEHVELFGWLYRLRPPRNPGAYDWASRQRRRGVVARLRCKSARDVRRLAPNPPPRHRDVLAWFRATVRGMLTDDLATGSDEEAGLLEAMVLGHRSGLDRRLNSIFIRAGCIHFLAVSGIHVGIVMFFVWWACRVLGLRRSGRALAMMAAVILYAAVTEPRPPILRASVLSLLYCVSLLLQRERSYLNWISAAAVVLAVLDPPMVFDPGYQLSFTAVLGVSYFFGALAQVDLELRTWWSRVVRGRSFEQQDRALALKLGPPRPLLLRVSLIAFQRGWRLLASSFAVSVSAWCVTVPILATSFHQIHAWGALNSMLVFPVVSVSMLLGFAKLMVGAISPTIGSAIGWVLGGVDAMLLGLVDRLSALPGATLAIEAPPWWVTTSFYLFLALVVWSFPRERRVVDEREADPNIKPAQPPPRPRRAQRRACLVALLVLVVTITTWQWPSSRKDRLVVTVLSVGAGSATIIELPDGRTVLYDAGSANPSDVGRSVVVPFLRHQGSGRIDRVYLSHPNLDHFSGLPSIVSEIPTGPILLNRYFEPRSGSRSPSRHLLKLLANSNHPVQTIDSSGESWAPSGVTFEYLAPGAGFPDDVSANNTSTVLRLAYGGHSILFTGDIEERALRTLIERGDLHADVLLLPHHGSVEISTPAFIHAVDPAVVIRSSAEPTRETLNGLLHAVGRVPLYNTADVGAIRIVIQRDDVGHYELRIASVAPDGG